MEALVESQNFMETPSRKKKKYMGEKQKLQKEMMKRYEGFDPVETSANPRADLSVQERKEFEGKIKLENNLIGTGYNTVILKVKIL